MSAHAPFILQWPLVSAMVMLLSLPALGALGSGPTKGPDTEDLQASTVPLVWVVSNPQEPRASLIQKLPEGGVVSVLGSRGAWSRVAIMDGTGQGGFVLNRLLKAATPKAARRARLEAAQGGAAEGVRVGRRYGTDDRSSGYRQASVAKVWVVADPERIVDTLLLKLQQGQAVRVRSAGETWSKVDLPDGSGRHGYVMNRWTLPASFDAIRRARFQSNASSTAPRVTRQPNAKAPYLIKTPGATAKTGGDAQAKSVQPSDVAPKTKQSAKARVPALGESRPTPKGSVIKLAGMTPPAEGNAAEKPEATSEWGMGTLLTVLGLLLGGFGLLRVGLRHREKQRLGLDAMDSLGNIRIDANTMLTLVKVPGKLLVMLKTPEGVDILREIATDKEVAPREVRQILENSFVGPLPTRGTTAPSLSPAEALASRGAQKTYRNGRQVDLDPLQSRLNNARGRMRGLMGIG